MSSVQHMARVLLAAARSEVNARLMRSSVLCHLASIVLICSKLCVSALLIIAAATGHVKGRPDHLQPQCLF